MPYQIFSDATADACPSMMAGLPPVTIIPMEVTLGDEPYTYGPGGNLTVEQANLPPLRKSTPWSTARRLRKA